ncbi:MAG TPA: hypothetical protein VF771_18455, partial [Longimicrobiaceae bacterium]
RIASFAIAENGDLVYTLIPYIGLADREVYRYRGGSVTRLALEDGTVSHVGTDGAGVVYLRAPPGGGYQVVLLTGPESLDLTSVFALSEAEYSNLQLTVVNGWTVYAQRAAGGTLQLWSRSPSGTARQVTDTGYGALAAVGPNGEAVYTLAGGNRYLLAKPPYTAAPLDVGPSGTRFKWIGDELFALWGRWAFVVSY